MEFRRGDKLYFWNKRTGKPDFVEITALSSDLKAVQFRYGNKLYKCKADYASIKLFERELDIPEYRLKSEIEFNRFYDASGRKELNDELERRSKAKRDHLLSEDTMVIGGE